MVDLAVWLLFIWGILALIARFKRTVMWEILLAMFAFLGMVGAAAVNIISSGHGNHSADRIDHRRVRSHRKVEGKHRV